MNTLSRLALRLAACAAVFSHLAIAQTVTVNGTNCSGATVTLGAGTIAINTNGCGTTTTPTAPTITSGAPPASASVGAAYTFSFTASGTTPITWTSTGTLPTGLSLSSAGVLSGTPTATGTSSFTVTAANGTTPNATSPSYSITVTNTPAITSVAPAAAIVNSSYTHNFIASQAITTWSTTGTLPPGLIFGTSGANGVLTGIPTATGSYPFVVSAANANGTATQNVTLVVNAGATAPLITSSAPTATATVGTAYSFTFAASGTAPISWTVASGTVPTGMTLSAAGVLSGTPTAAGTFNFAVKAANGTTPDATSNTFTVVVSSPAPGGSVVAVDGTVVPTISKNARAAGATHAGPMGGGSYSALPVNGYSIAASRCTASPAITTNWHHNIDLLDYGYKNATDFIDFDTGQALTYQFVAPPEPTSGFSKLGQLFVIAGPGSWASPAASFLTLTTTPCDFDVSKANTNACYRSSPSDNNLDYEISNAPAASSPIYCKITPGQTYYINLRWQNTSVPGVDSCAGHCGNLLQIKKY